MAATPLQYPAPPPGQPLADDADLSATVIGRGTAAFLAGFLLLILVAVPLLDAVLPALRPRAPGADAAQHPLLALLGHPPALASFTPPVHRQGVDEVNPLEQAERALMRQSTLRGWAGAAVRAARCALFHSGSRTVAIGAGGWLYYRPGLDYLSGRALPAAAPPRTSATGSAGPEAAITAFARDCAAAGARLIVVMIPDKAAIAYAPLGLAAPPAGRDYDNPGADALVRRLRGLGITVYVPSAELRQVAARSAAFLRQDSHWTPEAMDIVARGIAALARAAARAGTGHWRLSEQAVSSQGDLVAALSLPGGQTLFPPESARIGVISDAATGARWSSRAGAPLLLLGDSFANIFQDPALGWGESAGLGAHLAYHLGCEVEAIAVNGGGGDGARSLLARRPAALQGRTAVVWEFAMRELTQAPWRTIPMPSAPGRADSPMAGPPAGRAVRVAVTAISRIPDRDAALYPDALTTLTVRVVAAGGAGAGTAGELLLALPCLRHHALLPAARLRVGDALLVTMIPFAAAGEEVMRRKRYDDSGRYDLPLFLGEELQPAPPAPSRPRPLSARPRRRSWPTGGARGCRPARPTPARDGRRCPRARARRRCRSPARRAACAGHR